MPIIDEHNKQRQGTLSLERKWATRDCWFRLLTTMIGFCAVDMHRWCMYEKANSDDNEQMIRRRSAGTNANDLFHVEVDYEIEIKKFSDMLCGCLESAIRKQRAARACNANPSVAPAATASDNGMASLERIRGANGSKTREPTEKQLASGRNVGTAMNRNCFVCRKYLKKDGRINYVQTCFCCSVCKMPLCKESHYDASIGRYFTCFEEHMVTDEEHLQCNGQHVVKSAFPADKMVNLHPEARTILNSQSRTNPTTTIQNTTPIASTVQTSNIRRRSGRSSNESTRTIEKRRNPIRGNAARKEPRRQIPIRTRRNSK